MKSLPISKTEKRLEEYLVDYLKNNFKISEFKCGNVMLPFTNSKRAHIKFTYSQEDHPTLTIVDKNGNNITLDLYKKLFKNYNEYWKTRQAFWDFYDWYIEVVKNRQNQLLETVRYKEDVFDLIEFFDLTDLFKILFLREFDTDKIRFQLYPYEKVKKQLETLRKMIIDPKPFIRLYTNEEI